MTKRLKALLGALVMALTFVGAAALTACAEDPSEGDAGDTVAVSSISVNCEDLVSLYVGEFYPVQATVLPSNASDKRVRWTSSDETVVTVDGGLVTAIGAGVATVTVKSVSNTSKFDEFDVFVSAASAVVPVTGVTLNADSLNLTVGEQSTLTATVAPTNATNKAVTWESSNQAVATVNAGVVTAQSVGTATVTVRSAANTSAVDTLTVTVTQATSSVLVSSVSIQEESVTLEVGDVRALTTTVLPADASDKALNWQSNNPSVVSVVDGVLTANAQGSATITVISRSDVSKFDRVQVTVTGETNVPVTNVLLNKSTLNMVVGDSEQLTATVLPTNASDARVRWESTNDAVASVSGGLVVANGAGTATVNAISESDSTVLASAQVIVTAPVVNVPVTSVSLDTSAVSLEVGDVHTFVVTVLPQDATNKEVTWASSNSSVVSVGAGNQITALSEGSATVTVTTRDGNRTATCAVTVTDPNAPPASVPVTSVSLNESTLSLMVGETSTLTATVLPQDATDNSVTWASSNNAVATVQNGMITAISTGTATVTVTTNDGARTATCTVTVTPDVSLLTMEEGVHYSNTIGEVKDGILVNEDVNIDKDVFRYNMAGISAGDPFILSVTQESSAYYGKYILFSTMGGKAFAAYMSSDLIEWEYAGLSFNPQYFSWGYETLWAPEVIFDPDTNLYYMFYSAKNRKATSYNSAQQWWVTINVAVCDNPVGPYVEYQEYLVQTGQTDVTRWTALQSPHYSWEQLLANDPARTSSQDYFTSIDPSPFIDPVTNKKYLLFTRDRVNGSTHTWVYIMEMEDWATPKYNTLTRLTSADTGGYELSNNNINEGPQMIYNEDNGQYYLTFSVNSYQNSTYCVGQAIGSSPTGPFTKLTMAQGGALIYSNDSQGEAGGTGHHTFLKVGDKTYIAYHRHTNKIGGANAARELAIDEVKFIQNNQGQTILHMNGPSTTIMPAIMSDYENIAPDATVSVNGGTGVEALNDGIIAPHSYNSSASYSWVKTFKTPETSKTTTEITLTFDEWRTVAGLIIYQGRNNSSSAGYHAFSNIDKIEMQVKRNGKDSTVVINDLAVDESYLTDGTSSAIRLGSGAYASFDELIVKSIKISLYDAWGDGYYIEDITVLGKTEAANANYVDPNNPTGELQTYEYEKYYTVPVPTGDAVTLDGSLSESLYSSQVWYSKTASGKTIRATVVYGAEGFYSVVEVKNIKVYVDKSHCIHERWTSSNSGVQLFFGFPDGDTRAIEVNINADAYMDSYLYYHTYNETLDSAGVLTRKDSFQRQLFHAVSKTSILGGSLNTSSATGFVIETYYPWSAFGIDSASAPSSLYMDINVIEALDSTSTSNNNWIKLGESYKSGWTWNNCTTFWKWNANGYVG